MRRVIKIEQNIYKIPARTRVAAYCRVSLENESMLHSLANQVSYYSDFIQKQRGWQYVGVYADEAISGTSNNRPEFNRLLADCREGKIDMVITKSISRFARNTLTMLEVVRELKSINVDVFFEKENIHSISGDGELMLTILSSFAQEESLSVSENCKWRIRKRFQNGELVSLRYMFGYKIKNGVIEIDPAQAKVVRQIYKDYLDGLGFSKIATKLRESKTPAFKGGFWSSERVGFILKNEKYTGNSMLQKKYSKDHLSKLLVVNYGELPKYYVKDTHPAIIDEETFLKAQEIRLQNLEASPRKPTTVTYLFTSKITCGKCGKHFKRKIARGKVFWNCHTYLKYGKKLCHAKQIPEDILCTLSEEALGLSEFNEILFEKRIKEIIIPEFNHLVFVFHDGTRVEKTYIDKSRSDGWNEAARQQASERLKKRREELKVT